MSHQHTGPLDWLQDLEEMMAKQWPDMSQMTLFQLNCVALWQPRRQLGLFGSRHTMAVDEHLL